MTTLLQSFITFVEAQPPRRRYDFHSTKQCALAQFTRAHFRAPYVTAGAYSITVGDDAISAQTIWVHESADVGLALINCKTFGQLAKALAPFKETTDAHQ